MSEYTVCLSSSFLTKLLKHTFTSFSACLHKLRSNHFECTLDSCKHIELLLLHKVTESLFVELSFHLCEHGFDTIKIGRVTDVVDGRYLESLHQLLYL